MKVYFESDEGWRKPDEVYVGFGWNDEGVCWVRMKWWRCISARMKDEENRVKCMLGSDEGWNFWRKCMLGLDEMMEETTTKCSFLQVFTEFVGRIAVSHGKLSLEKPNSWAQFVQIAIVTKTLSGSKNSTVFQSKPSKQKQHELFEYGWFAVGWVVCGWFEVRFFFRRVACVSPAFLELFWSLAVVIGRIFKYS